jgi:hypothetical protein
VLVVQSLDDVATVEDDATAEDVVTDAIAEATDAIAEDVATVARRNRRTRRNRNGKGRIHSENPFRRDRYRRGRCAWRLRKGDKGFCCPHRRRGRCVGQCSFCPRRRSVRSIFRSASHVAAVRVRTKGLTMQTSGGSSIVWAANEFEHVASVRHAHDCAVSHMDLIKSVGRRKTCSKSLKVGRVYVVSGQCRGGVFFVDPCGVRMRLGRRQGGSRRAGRSPRRRQSKRGNKRRSKRGQVAPVNPYREEHGNQ